MIREKSAGKTKVRSAARGAGRTARQARAAAASLPVETFTPQIETEIAGVRFQNPVWTASGTFGYAKEFAHLIDLDRAGDHWRLRARARGLQLGGGEIGAREAPAV